MPARTYSVPLDAVTAQRLDQLVRVDDRSPGRIIAASLQLYTRLSIEAQAAYRRLEAFGTDRAQAELLAEVNRAILQAAEAACGQTPAPPRLSDDKRQSAEVPAGSGPLQPPRPALRATKELLSIRDFCQAYGIGRSTAYAEMKEGRLKAKKIGRRTVIPRVEAERWLSSLRDR